MPYKQAVALLPGFLGFEKIGEFYYFADRVEAALSSALKALAPEQRIPVVPVPTLPTARLQDRQARLLVALARIDDALGGVKHLHLVGHSTGGVDATLLTGSHPLDRTRHWKELDPAGVRKKLRTIITLASPHHGTGLALSPLAQFFRQPLAHPTNVTSFAEALLLLASSVSVDNLAINALVAAIADVGAAGKYAFDVLRARQLIDDLRPAHLAEVHHGFRQSLKQTRIRSIVTMAGRSTNYYVDATGRRGLRTPDAFFNFIYDQTATGSTCEEAGPNQHLLPAINCLEAAIAGSRHIIQNRNTELHDIDLSLNDGFVNSARQLLRPKDKDELLAVVVADHLDVLGHYPRWITPEGRSPLERRVSLHSGILHSGSGFGDDEFFELYLRVAQGVLES